MTAATKAGGAVLPVVCYVAQSDGLPKFGAGWMFSKIETGPATLALTPHAPAQATIDELRAEVEALKAAQPVAVDRVMELAEKYAAWTAIADNNTSRGAIDACNAAREALRACLLGDGGTL